jgi:hypothetical protein
MAAVMITSSLRTRTSTGFEGLWQKKSNLGTDFSKFAIPGTESTDNCC